MAVHRLHAGSYQSRPQKHQRSAWPWVGRWLFTFEISSKQQPVVGNPLWLGGRIEVQQEPGRVTPYLGTFEPQIGPATLPPLGTEHTLQRALEVSDRQLQLIEEGRHAGDLQLDIYLSGYAVQDGQYAEVGESQISHQISQSDWLTLLERVGYRQLLLLELEAPNPLAQPVLAEAIAYFTQAQRHYLEGEWRLTVESLRQRGRCHIGGLSVIAVFRAGAA